MSEDATDVFRVVCLSAKRPAHTTALTVGEKSLWKFMEAT
jgi:hypothetical protein